jgi:hypothetical protein
LQNGVARLGGSFFRVQPWKNQTTSHPQPFQGWRCGFQLRWLEPSVILSGVARNEPRSRRIPCSFEGAVLELPITGLTFDLAGILRLRRYAPPLRMTPFSLRG